MSPQWKPSRNAPASSRKGQKLAEIAAPVILRWQDLGELPKYEVIIKAPEEKNLLRGKGKAQISNKAKGPPLANYIKASEYSKACKMCCNTDYHATFQCPNLTPELKEMLKEVRSKCAKFKPYHPDDLTCHICLKKGDHWSSECSYTNHYPAGAIVGPSAAIVCKCCGTEDAHPGKPGVDWGAIAVRKFCYACGCPSDHWDKGCPKASASKGAAAVGSGMKASASKGAAAVGSGMEASASKGATAAGSGIKASSSKGAGAATGIKESSSKGVAAVAVTSTSMYV